MKTCNVDLSWCLKIYAISPADSATRLPRKYICTFSFVLLETDFEHCLDSDRVTWNTELGWPKLTTRLFCNFCLPVAHTILTTDLESLQTLGSGSAISGTFGYSRTNRKNLVVACISAHKYPNTSGNTLPDTKLYINLKCQNPARYLQSQNTCPTFNSSRRVRFGIPGSRTEPDRYSVSHRV